MRPSALLLIALWSCGRKDTGDEDSPEGEDPDPCDALDAAGPPLLVEVVDETGAPRAADRVRWLDLDGSTNWEDAAWAACAGDAKPPCDTWEVREALPALALIAAELRSPEADPPDRTECMGWGATAAVVSASTAPQLLRLTLPADALWCDDGASIGVENVARFDAIDEAECLVSPGVPEGSLEVSVWETDGTPSAAAWVQWYYHPKSAEYDGDHDLGCAAAGCAEWASHDDPAGDAYYVAAFSYGPPVPDYLPGYFWTAYSAGPVSEAVPLALDLEMEWSLVAF